MKFRVERDVLADAVAWTARTLPVRPPVPVLAGLLLEVDTDGGQTLALSSFDYEVSAAVSVEIAASEGGRTLVSGRLLAEITRSLPAQPVDIMTEGARMVVTCGTARFTLPTLPVDDYPSLPDMPAASGLIGSDAFATAVAQVAVAAGRDDTLPVLTGVRVEIDGDRLTLAATDRYRLAVRELTWQPGTDGLSATALVPAKTLADTAKSLASGAEITIALATGGSGEGMVGFEGAGRRTTTRLLEGEFPKYRSLFPAAHAAVAELPTAVFVEAVRRVSLVAPRNSSVRLGFSADGLVLEAGGGEDAQASEGLDCSYEGEPMTIAFNPAYLLDGLGAIDSDTAVVSFTTPSKPAVLTGKRSGDDGGAAGSGDYSYLLMPVRLSG
ncbi:MAG: polymerase subunit beta [Frankiales bacterium]|nr:polymerase subunit beta [Frankiales bacterium]